MRVAFRRMLPIFGSVALLSGLFTLVSSGALTAPATALGTPPQAQGQAYAVAENGTLTVPAASGLLVGVADSNAGATSFTAAAASSPANGTVTVNADGSFTYTPTLGFTGTDSFTYTATDNLGNVSSPATVDLTVSSAPPVTVSPTTLPGGTVGEAYGVQLSATGGTGPYTFAVTSGSAPAGTSVTSSGLVSGTPTAAGPASFTVTATDSLSNTGSQPYTVDIGMGTTSTAIISAEPPFAADPSEPVSLIAQVTAAGSGPAPTGTVTFSFEFKGLPGITTLGSTPVGANGLAFFTTTAGQLTVGPLELWATYSGDSNYAMSTGELDYIIDPTCSLSSWPSQVTGFPLVHPSFPRGFYIGQENGEFNVTTAKPDKGVGTGATTFTGTITTDGRLLGVEARLNEHQDKVVAVGDNEISFKWVTHLATDSMSFFAACGTELTFDLSVNGVPATTSQIFLGNPTTNPSTNPVTFSRS